MTDNTKTDNTITHNTITHNTVQAGSKTKQKGNNYKQLSLSHSVTLRLPPTLKLTTTI
jgi:hypothetical protein